MNINKKIYLLKTAVKGISVDSIRGLPGYEDVNNYFSSAAPVTAPLTEAQISAMPPVARQAEAIRALETSRNVRRTPGEVRTLSRYALEPLANEAEKLRTILRSSRRAPHFLDLAGASFGVGTDPLPGLSFADRIAGKASAGKIDTIDQMIEAAEKLRKSRTILENHLASVTPSLNPLDGLSIPRRIIKTLSGLTSQTISPFRKLLAKLL